MVSEYAIPKYILTKESGLEEFFNQDNREIELHLMMQSDKQ